MSAKKGNGSISGFPELLPEVRRIEQQWLDIIRMTFESYGFASLETAAVEELKTIAAKGEDVDKEIYTLSKLNAAADANEPKLALHFDMTVPMARYVAENYNDLTFPFKRYQVQKAWRGERPQEGRYREFAQCDIDVIDNDKISVQFDAELPRIIHKILGKIGIEDIQTHLNNRKIIQGYYQGLGIEEPMNAIRIIDKIDKIGATGVADLLKSRMGLGETTVERCLQLAEIKTFDSSFVEKVQALGIANDLLDEGLRELRFVMDSLRDLPKESICVNLSIARGLDYYTGTVFEGKFLTYPKFPTIYAGGRYDNLVGSYLKKKLPGIGMSIGLTRILLKLLKEKRLDIGEKSPTDILLLNQLNDDHLTLLKKAEVLRDRGINTEVYHDNQKKTGLQIAYGDKKGIRYVLFSSESGDQVKDIISGEQTAFDVHSWVPDRSHSFQTTLQPSARRSALPVPPDQTVA